MRGTSAVASTVLVAAITASLHSPLTAQAANAEHTYGGFVNAVWLERIPRLTGDPDGFRVWTAEDGSRIRFYDSTTDSITEMNVLSSSAETLHDIYLDQYPGATAEAIFGVAVGTNGEAVWWDSLGHNNWKPFTPPPAPGKSDGTVVELSAVENGVSAVVIMDGRMENACLLELFTDYGAGSMIRA